MTIRVLLADDQTILRKGIRSLFGNHPGYEIVGEAVDGLEVVAMAKQLVPDIVMMDITMPGLNGLEATQRIIGENPKIKVIVLSVHSDKRFIEKAIASGASGYLRKDCEFDELLSAISAVLAGKRYISPFLSENHEPVEFDLRTNYSVELELSGKERQILRLIAEGKTTKEIASQLFLSIKSIERYRQIIMEKLNIHTIAELTKYAISEGIIPLD
jgi:two-component system, NarL family, response regulator NreC